MKFKSIYYVVTILTFAGLGTWYLGERFLTHSYEVPESENSHEIQDGQIKLSQKQIDDLGIELQTAAPASLSVELVTRGKIILHPDRLAHILPKISGIANAAFKNIGDEVKQGEVLAILESREIADAYASYLSALEKEHLSQGIFEREKNLYDKKITAEQDFLSARSLHKEARINLELSKQKLHAYGISEEEIKELSEHKNTDSRLYKIRSPIDGIVLQRHITKGEYIENTNMIYEIANFEVVWVEIGIYPKDLDPIKVGQLVEVINPNDGRQQTASIIFVSPVIEDETITAKAVAEIENSTPIWRPGTFVKVHIATNKIKAPIAIPHEAIQEINNQPTIFVKNAEGFEIRPVTLGEKDHHLQKITSGLEEGERFAASKTFILKAELGKNELEHED